MSSLSLKNLTVSNGTTTPTSPTSFTSSSEYANYFCEYAKLYHQKDMLEDVLRMRAYYQAIVGNPSVFKDKVVLDVGSGTGVLAMWAAQAGAKKVYAVEATPMAANARVIIQQNNLQNIVQVLQSKVEDIELPEKVDIIVSEWMGYLLVRESMLDSVIFARDHFLKEGGALYPSHARICWGAVVNEHGYEENAAAFHETMSDWQRFLVTMKSDFNIDMSSMTKKFEDENREYFLNQATYRNLASEQVLAENCSTTELDLNTVTVEELRVIKEDFTMDAQYEGQVTALACWFETDFKGSKQEPTPNQVTLDTSPHVGETHWGQQVFYLERTVPVQVGDVLHVTSVIQRHRDNDRMVHCTMGLTKLSKKDSSVPPITFAPRLFHIQ
eukprot:g5054.t1